MADTSGLERASLAKAAGLGRAWQDHQADVEEAIGLAARIRGAFTRPADPAAEPAPAYAAPTCAPSVRAR
jgi:hypothetical protein